MVWEGREDGEDIPDTRVKRVRGMENKNKHLWKVFVFTLPIFPTFPNEKESDDKTND